MIYDTGSLLRCDGQCSIDWAEDDLATDQRCSGRAARRGYAVIERHVRSSARLSPGSNSTQKIIPNAAAIHKLKRGYLPRARLLLTARIERASGDANCRVRLE